MADKKLYIVGYIYGTHEAFQSVNVFTTFDIDKARAWKRRFDNIISNNEDRLINYGHKGGDHLWWNLIVFYGSVEAFVEEIKAR
jgi:hypothetical protein